jgi:hypothetical protein
MEFEVMLELATMLPHVDESCGCGSSATGASSELCGLLNTADVGTLLQRTAVRDCFLLFGICADWAPCGKKEKAVKRNRTMSATLHGTSSRKQLNELMEAIALIIARRQMKRRWPPSGYRHLSASDAPAAGDFN